MEKKNKLLIKVSILGFLAALFFITSRYIPYNEGRGIYVFSSVSSSPLKDDKDISNAWEVQRSFRKIFELYKNRVVFISTEQTVRLPAHPFFDNPLYRNFFGEEQFAQPRTQKRRGLGTGFVLSEDGYIGTNHHLVDGMDMIKVKINQKIYNARIVGTDERTDIALLKITPDEKLKPVFIGDSDKVSVGDWAISIGNPFGLDNTFTVGVISATVRKGIDLAGTPQSHIQTDASINPGNSGGPLINIDGEVIGINRMIYSNTGGNMGIGFAIPINTAKRILEQLKIHKKIKRGFIGVHIVPMNEEYSKKLELQSNNGVLVGAVINNSPADRGGIKAGDVILKIDNRNINDYTDFFEKVEKTPIGDALKFSVWRWKNKSTLSLSVTVSEEP